MINVKIRGIEVYHGENIVYADEYIEHFKKQGKDIQRLLESYGRGQYYTADRKKDNTLLMGYEATKRLLKKEGLVGNDIDLIVFCSQCPEYLIPAQATILHGLIEGNIKAQVMDINVNCAGMLAAFDSVARIMHSRANVKRALIVGAECLTFTAKETDEYTYPIFGDAGCALIIEKTQDEESVFVDSEYRTSGETWKLVTYPAKGFSIEPENMQENMYMKWTPFDASFVGEQMRDGLMELLSRTPYELSDIKIFCSSQYAIGLIDNCASAIDISREKFIYVGDEYGYTGTSSPFIALYEAIKDHRIQRGDLINLWTVGTHWTIVNILLKY
ncbi:MAG: 3-oxoacyl-[acyl-carrier-protein] synthase III C-terminal domain-containing protein [Cellulosilyticaceae bacterium]